MKCNIYTVHGFQLFGFRVTLCAAKEKSKCLDNVAKSEGIHWSLFWNQCGELTQAQSVLNFSNMNQCRIYMSNCWDEIQGSWNNPPHFSGLQKLHSIADMPGSHVLKPFWSSHISWNFLPTENIAQSIMSQNATY